MASFKAAPKALIENVRAALPITCRLSSLSLATNNNVIFQRAQLAALKISPFTFSIRRWSSAIVASSASTEDALPSNLQENQEEEYVVINFYHLVAIDRPHAVIEAHKEYLKDKDVRGRIYFSEQGVNAQFGGPRKDAVAYAEWVVKTQPLFLGVTYQIKMDRTDGHQYPKMRIQYKPNLISLAGGMSGLPVTDPAARATPLKPSQWREMLNSGVDGQKPVVLDVRNSYEWDAGHFVGAARPLEEEFNETPTESTPVDVPRYLQEAGPDTPVMMYCTGGIRCDVYSAYLKKKGYTNLYTLEGGVQTYMKEEGLEKWNGSLFVFDGRMAIRPNKDEEAPLEAAAPCALCGGTAELPHTNCANIDCNKLFMACSGCKSQLKGCCCEACITAPRLLRPMKTKGQYGNWTEYTGGSVSDTSSSEDKMATGRGEGRISRRRKRQAALKDKELAKRALKVERRRHAKEAMAAAVLGENVQLDTSGNRSVENESEERMAKLRELKERLQNSSSYKTRV
jgi:predicted sulfurtransferase